MFTGLIEEVGIVQKKAAAGKGIKFSVSAQKILSDLKIGDSINVNGVCQTVTELTGKEFYVEAVEETLKKTNLGKLKLNDRVNLERSLRASDRLGGHFVLGHVDTTGKIISITELSNSHMVKISYPKEFSKYLIPVGSIAVNGVSLTVAELDQKSFTVAIIPHTWKETVFSSLRISDEVNLEFDILEKYILRFLEQNKPLSFSEDWLKQLGY